MFLKDADAVIDYRVDWSSALQAGAALAASGWAVAPAEAGGIVVVTSWTEGGFAGARLGGGLPGHVYRVGNRVTMPDGSVDERSLAIRVEER